MERKRLNTLPTRRDLLKGAGLAVAGSMLNGLSGPLNVSAQGKVTPRNTARNVIYLEMSGRISQADTFDYKEQWNQPKDLDVRKINSELNLSKTLFPQLSDRMDKISIVRSLRAAELVHFNGEYHTQTGRALNPALAKEIPAFGSLIAYELESGAAKPTPFRCISPPTEPTVMRE